MPADNNYNELIEDICKKISNSALIKESDVLDIKNSIESIENLMTDNQSKLNFQEIKEKLQTISSQIEGSNDSVLKDLHNDLNDLKTASENVKKYLENINNNQNLALTSAEFEDYQKHQLDLAIKTNENIYNELKSIQNNTQIASSPENLVKLQDQLNTIHKSLSETLQKTVNKLQETASLDEIGALLSDSNNYQQKNIKQTNEFLQQLQAEIKDLHSEFKNKDFEKQITKICEIYDSLTIINAWIEKVGFINKSIENIYARFGESINFDDISEKVDIIYENVSALNVWTQKVDNIETSSEALNEKIDVLSSSIGKEQLEEIKTKITELSEKANDIKSINETLNLINTYFGEDLDLNDIADKMDIVYENLSSLNNWVIKLDSIEEKMNNKLENIEDIHEKINKINSVFEENTLSDKIELIYENISLLNDWIIKIDNISKQSDEINSKLEKTSENLSAKIDEIINTISNYSNQDILDIQETLSSVAKQLSIITNSTKNDSNEYIYTLLDIESDFLKLNTTLENFSNNTSENITNLKEKLDENAKIISEDIKTLKYFIDGSSKTTYNQLDELREKIEDNKLSASQDINSLKYIIDDNSKITSDDLNSLQARFSELNDDISSISIRTNKLILSADDANKEFKDCLESFKAVIQEVENKKEAFNPDLKYALIAQKIGELTKLTQNILINNQNINNAFIYMAEWIDATGNVLNNIQKGLEEIKIPDNAQAPSSNNDEIKNLIKACFTQVEELENSVSSIKTDDISELKSLLTGIIVQLHTALKPDIDALNERIDKLTEENSNKLSELEVLLNEKIDYQAKQINSLEEKIENLNNKFSKLIDAMSEEQKNYEIKDVLNYIATQITSVNEAVNAKSSADNSEALNEISSKVNKLVSYIEEE